MESKTLTLDQYLGEFTAEQMRDLTKEERFNIATHNMTTDVCNFILEGWTLKNEYDHPAVGKCVELERKEQNEVSMNVPNLQEPLQAIVLRDLPGGFKLVFCQDRLSILDATNTIVQSLDVIDFYASYLSASDAQVCVECLGTQLDIIPEYPHVAECADCGHPNDADTTTISQLDTVPSADMFISRYGMDTATPMPPQS